jgi:hypothetical protein
MHVQRGAAEAGGDDVLHEGELPSAVLAAEADPDGFPGGVRLDDAAFARHVLSLL